MTKTIALLGATGSIGRQTLEVARELGISVAALTAHTQIDLLEQQARQFMPRLAVLYDPDAARELEGRLRGTGIEVLAGEEGLLEKYGAEIVPVDSEHSAVFQCLQGCRDRREVRRILLTCSGGPFYGKTFGELEDMTAADALRHPNWHMGPKITVDSATLMNKGLEVIEAMRLYRLPVEQVQAVIHRQSIVHSLVEFRDGALLAQLGTPDMKLPIRYAMTYPHRAESPNAPLDLLTCGALTFDRPDEEAFPCLRLAREAAAVGGTACAILNGANEAAVGLFLQGKLGFNDIPRRVERALERMEVQYQPSLADILEADRAARRAVL